MAGTCKVAENTQAGCGTGTEKLSFAANIVLCLLAAFVLEANVPLTALNCSATLHGRDLITCGAGSPVSKRHRGFCV